MRRTKASSWNVGRFLPSEVVKKRTFYQLFHVHRSNWEISTFLVWPCLADQLWALPLLLMSYMSETSACYGLFHIYGKYRGWKFGWVTGAELKLTQADIIDHQSKAYYTVIEWFFTTRLKLHTILNQLANFRKLWSTILFEICMLGPNNRSYQKKERERERERERLRPAQCNCRRVLFVNTESHLTLEDNDFQ